MPPSTGWTEVPTPDEPARHAQQADAVRRYQSADGEQAGKGRAFHRIGLLALRASLEVHDQLPEHARQGLFATPGRLDTWVRLSNGAPRRQRDRTPDVRGFALKVAVPERPGALGGTTHFQDFALINREAFGFRTSAEFLAVVEHFRKGPAALAWHFVRTRGFFAGLSALSALARSNAAPFAGFASAPFYSAAPLAWGPWAVRVRLQPAAQDADPNAADSWADDLRRRLAKGPLAYPFQVQFFTDEATTPIEDATSAWPESAAPFETVGTLHVPPQPLEGPAYEAFARQVEEAVFDPWEALVEHRPLGEVMRSRKAAYFASQQGRVA